MIKFGSSFELAFRRSIFSLFLILIYLLVGSLLLSLIAQMEQSKKIAEICKGQKESQNERRLDFERTELLNTLWAELLASKSGTFKWEFCYQLHCHQNLIGLKLPMPNWMPAIVY